jgi:hypothetical protein
MTSRTDTRRAEIALDSATLGAYLACTFWLAGALHGIGRHAHACNKCDRLLAIRNDVGPLSETHDTFIHRQARQHSAGRQQGRVGQYRSPTDLLINAHRVAVESTPNLEETLQGGCADCRA